jgi:hypothetical protein
MEIGPGTGPSINPPLGGVPSEDVELLRRRTSAVIMRVFGILMIIAFIPAGILFGIETHSFQAGITVGLLLLIVGSILEWYGGYLYKKYQHVMWTKQAIREYDQQRMHARMDAAEAYRMAREATSTPSMSPDKPAEVPPPQHEMSRPATPAAAMVSASLTLPNGSAISLSTTDRWIGRDDLRQSLTSGGLQFVSREHILMSYANGRFYIEDQKSSNGTKLNGNEIKGKGRFELKDGDVIELANEVKLAFRVL